MHRLASASFRRAAETDLDACARVWKAGIDDYQGRLNQPPLPDEVAPIRRLLAHLLATDPDRFWVAVNAGDGDPQAIRQPGKAARGDVIAFASAAVREGLWFLAMLFVDPPFQARGLGGALLDRAQAGRDVEPSGPMVPGPDDPLDTGIRLWGMCTDTVQPISNGLYARRGMVPRVPIWRLFGEVRRWSAVPQLPRSLEAVPFDVVAAEGPDGQVRIAAIVDDLDREIIGSAHGADHAFLRRDGRTGFLVRERGGRTVGYAYGSSAGRLGPVAALDPALHPALIGVAVRETPALGPVAVWVPGTADLALRALLDAGLRFDGFPGLICWSSSGHPFDRYLPISMALV